LVMIVSLLGASRTEAAGRKILAIGSNVGLPDDEPLRHAAEDARRTADALTELAGPEPPEVRLLLDPSPADVLGALSSFASSTRASGSDAVIVYFSGHGDEEALHLGGALLPLDQLRRALNAIDVPLKIVIIDACRTSARNKGLAVGPVFSVAPALGQYRGLVTVMASGPGESAQESSRLRGGVFTHFLVSGLRGAADRDGDHRVTLSEVYDFAHARTLARSVAQAGLVQRPEIKIELEGSGPLVLTWLDPARSRLHLPAAADAHFYVYEKGSDALAAEAWGRPDGETTLALPSGRFVVHRQQGASHAVAEVSLAFGGDQQLSRATFAEIAPEEVALRRGGVTLQKSALALLGGVLGDADQRRGGSFGVRLLRQWRALVWGASLRLAALAGETTFNKVETRDFDGSLFAGWQWAGSHLTMHALAGLTGRLERMRLRDRAALAPEAAHVSHDELTVGAGPEVRLGATLPLSLHAGFLVEVGGRSVAFRQRQDRGAGEGAADEGSRLVVSHELGVDLGLVLSF